MSSSKSETMRVTDMFIKVPVYFEIIGTAPSNLGFLTENLQVYLEKTLLGRSQKVGLKFTMRELSQMELPGESEVFLIKREKVLDGMR